MSTTAPEKNRVVDGTPERRCSRCNGWKPLGDFYVANGVVSHRCKRCQLEVSNEYVERNPERRRSTARRSRFNTSLKVYGLTREQFDALVLRQEGRCAICIGQLERCEIDHDHATGVVRGLLCGQCNKALGLANDDVATLQRAVRYLESSRCTDVNAAWCPIHGDCTCETQPEKTCPLHDTFSMHGESQFHDGLVPVEG